MPQHTISVRVKPEEIDELGHVNNAVYLRYIEAVARSHSDSLGFGLREYLELGSAPVVRRHTVTYLAPARAEEELQIHTRIAALKGIRAIRETRINRGETTLVEAETEWVWICPSSGRPVKIPEEVVRAFSGLEA